MKKLKIIYDFIYMKQMFLAFILKHQSYFVHQFISKFLIEMKQHH